MAGKEDEQMNNFTKERPKVGQLVASLSDVSFASYTRELFYDVNLNIHKKEAIAILGESGSGKSLLLKMMVGEEIPNTGTIEIAKGTKVAYVPQAINEVTLNPNISIRDFYFSSRGLDKISIEKKELEEQMSKPTDDLEVILNRYGELQEKYEHLGGYVAESEMNTILAGLKLTKEETGHITPDTIISKVSSGQKTKILLGRALFSESDLLVLDDPTSHLDADSVKWLGEYLKGTNKAVLIATQKINFINSFSTRILEITDFGRVMSFQGNYNEYLVKRDELLKSEKLAAEAAANKLKKLRETYMKFKSEGVFKRSADMAQVGRALKTRMNRMETAYNEMPGSQQVFRAETAKSLIFSSENPTKNSSVGIKGISKSYGEYKAVNLSNVSLNIKKGDLVLISGENGSGKSTLVRIIADQIERNNEFIPDTGIIESGKDLKVGYFSPDNLGISNSGNMFEEIVDTMSTKGESEATAILIFFGFPKNEIRIRKIETLSMGEKRQLALAKIMAAHPDILLLDEPSDNIRPEINERLVDAINGFKGTVILVSHDGKFVDRLDVNQELTLPDGKIIIRDY